MFDNHEEPGKVGKLVDRALLETLNTEGCLDMDILKSMLKCENFLPIWRFCGELSSHFSLMGRACVGEPFGSIPQRLILLKFCFDLLMLSFFSL